MTENQKTNLTIILNQIEVAKTLAANTFPANHAVRLIVENAALSIKVILDADGNDTNVAPISEAKDAPAPLNPVVVPNIVPVDDVVDEQTNPENDVAIDVDNDLADLLGEEEITIAGLSPADFMQVLEETPEDIAQVILEAEEDAEIAVSGIIEKDGVHVEIGNWDENVGKLEETLADAEAALEEEGLPGYAEPEHAIMVRYSRMDGQALSITEVQNIIEHPVSAPLFRLGNLHLHQIVQGPDASTQIAQFEIQNPTRSVLLGLAIGAVQYRGIKVFPGIGQVEAAGSVNFEV